MPSNVLLEYAAVRGKTRHLGLGKTTMEIVKIIKLWCKLSVGVWVYGGGFCLDITFPVCSFGY